MCFLSENNVPQCIMENLLQKSLTLHDKDENAGLGVDRSIYECHFLFESNIEYFFLGGADLKKVFKAIWWHNI